MGVRTEFPRCVRRIDNTWIPLADGTRLAARVWLPDDAEDDPVPAILESTSSAKNVVDGDADMSYVSPGVFADAITQGLDLVSVWQMGAYDVFDIALPITAKAKIDAA